MSLLDRVRYSLYLAIVIAAILSLALVLGSADAIGILPASAFDFALSPTLFFVTYILSFIAAPHIAERFPIKRG